MKKFDSLLRNIYYDANNPASFSSVDKLYREACSRDDRIKRSDVENFLSGEIAYSLHRRIVRKFKRNPVVSEHHAALAQADLIDVSKFSKFNSGHNFILTVIDAFSKLAFALPIINKSGDNVRQALSVIIKNHSYQPASLQTDEGKEFLNKKVQQLLKENFIHFYVAKNKQIKCAIVERFQRTLMTKIRKYFTANGTRHYLSILQDVVDAYNNTFHRSIGMTPYEACMKENKLAVFHRLFGFSNNRDLIKSKMMKQQASLRPGQHVRIPHKKHVFEKGYRQNFKDSIYTIINANDRVSKKTFYKLKTFEGDVVPGRFYREQIVPVSNNDIYRVELIGSRGRGKSKQYRVRYHNFPKSPPVWIKASDLIPLS